MVPDDHGNPCGCEGHEPRDLFHANGLRCTRQRELIYRALLSTKAHPTAEELLGMVRADEPGLSLATVYNTLEAFTARGLARRLPSHSGNGPCRYDADVSQHMHITLDDGRVLDVPPDLAERLGGRLSQELAGELERRTGVRVTGVHLELFGRDARA
ncbi:MAG: transcriptional repressor [Phycisphaerales bacterium]